MENTKPLVPGSPEWQERVKQIAKEEEASQPLRWWYLSFSDEVRFLGAVIVKEHGFARAVLKAMALGINPGGEVRGNALRHDAPTPPDEAIDKLLSMDDLKRIFGEVVRWPD